MTSNDTTPTTESSASARERAIEAYDSTRERVSDTLGEAPLIALAGGLAAGALIAALLPRTRTEARLVRPTARRVKDTARAAAIPEQRDPGLVAIPGPRYEREHVAATSSVTVQQGEHVARAAVS